MSKYIIEVNGKQRTIDSTKFEDNKQALYEQMPDARIDVYDKNGNLGSIPLSKYEAALQRGFKAYTKKVDVEKVDSPSAVAKSPQGAALNELAKSTNGTFGVSAPTEPTYDAEYFTSAPKAPQYSVDSKELTDNAAQAFGGANKEAITNLKAEQAKDEQPMRFMPALARSLFNRSQMEKYTDPQKVINETFAAMKPYLQKEIETQYENAIATLQQGKELALQTKGVVNKDILSQQPINDESVNAIYNQIANDYANRVQDYLLNEYKKAGVPKNWIEYVAGSAFKNSIMGNLLSGIMRMTSGSSGLKDQIVDESYGEYEKTANIGEKIGAGVGTLAADAIPFALTGGLGAMAGKGAVSVGGNVIARSAAKSGLSSLGKSVATNAGKRMFTSSLGGRIASGAISGAVNLGSYDLMSETARQFKSGEYDAGAIAERGLHGALLGGITAPIGITGKYLTKTEGASVKLATDIGSFGLESAVFAVPSLIEKKNAGQDITWGDVGEELAISAGTLAMMKAKEIQHLKANIRSRYFNSELGDTRLSSTDKEYLESKGLSFGDLFKTEKIVESGTKLKERTKDSPLLLDEKGNKITETQVDDNMSSSEQILENTEIFTNYEKVLQDNEAPISLKRKLKYAIEGQIFVDVPAIYGTKITENQATSKWEVSSLNEQGNPIEVFSFKSKTEAESKNNKLNSVGERNSIEATEKIVDKYIEKSAIMKACAESPNGVELYNRFVEISKKDKAERTKDEIELLTGIATKAEKYYDKDSLSDNIAESVSVNHGVDVKKAIAKERSERSVKEQDAVDAYISALRSKIVKPNNNKEQGRDVKAKMIGTDEVVNIITDLDNDAPSPTDKVYYEQGGKVKVAERKDFSDVTETPIATIEDVIALNQVSADMAEFIREHPRDYEQLISELNEELKLSLQYSSGEIAERPDNFEYFAVTRDLLDPLDMPEEAEGEKVAELVGHTIPEDTTPPEQSQEENIPAPDTAIKPNILDTLPRTKKGELDYDNFSAEQSYEYAKVKFGEDKAQKMVAKQITKIEKEIQAKQKADEDSNLIESLRLNDEIEALSGELEKWKGFVDSEKEEDIPTDIKPIGVGAFGNIYDAFKGKAKEAISFLLQKREGEAVGALHHKDVGDIDLVWGKEGTAKSDGFGLAKLAKYHPEVLDNLQEILDEMHVTQRSDNRVQLESEKYQAAIRLTWDNEKKTWLLTMFEKKNSVLDNTTDTVKTQIGNGNDTATPENAVSTDKGSESVGEKQVNEVENTVPTNKRRKRYTNKQEMTLAQAKTEYKDSVVASERLENIKAETVDEVIGDMINGGMRFIVNDFGEGASRKRGFKSGTGYKNGETQSLFGLFRTREKGGLSFDEAGEAVEQELRERSIAYDEGSPQFGCNALQEFFSHVRTMGDVTNYVERKRIEEASRLYEQEMEMLMEEDAAYFAEKQHISIEDYEAREEVIYNELKEVSEKFDMSEIAANLAGEYADNLKQQEDNERGNENGDSGNKLLHKIQISTPESGGESQNERVVSERVREDLHREGEDTSGEQSGRQVTKASNVLSNIEREDVYKEDVGGREMWLLGDYNADSPGYEWLNNKLAEYRKGHADVTIVDAGRRGAAFASKDDAIAFKDWTIREAERADMRADINEFVAKAKRSNPSNVNSNELGEKVAQAESETNTSPTDAQKEAGNYKKGHVQVGSFDLTIENPKGSERKGTDANGSKWSVTMQNTYGYIRGTEGVDGDHIDVFIADDTDGWNGRKVFVVDQTNTDGSFDEHKVMLGFNEIEEAESAYFANYSPDWKEKHPQNKITAVNLEDFEKWINSSHRKTKAFAEYSSVKKEKANQVGRSPRDKAVLDALTDKLAEAIGEDNVITNHEEGQRVLDMANGKNVKNQLGDNNISFSERQRRAVESKGTVMPGLVNMDVEIVKGEKEHGFNNFKEAKVWAKENIVKTFSNEETGGKGKISISNNAVNKFLSESAVGKSENKDIYQAVLKVLPNVIKTSIEAEEHPDYKKGEDKVRKVELGINEDILVHRLYGAVDIDGKTYRVKVTMQEFKDANETNRAHSYEATKIELLAGTLVDTSKRSTDPNTSNSIKATNLLKGVEKSYDKGVKLLDASEVIREQRAFHGSHYNFEAFDHAHMGEGEGAQAHGYGTYVAKKRETSEGYAKMGLSERELENRVINKLAREALESVNGDRDVAIKGLEELFNEDWADKKRVGAQIKVLKSGRDLPEGEANLYSVEIPDDNGSNYLDEHRVLDDSEIGSICDKLSGRDGVGFDFDYFMEKVEGYLESNNLDGYALYQLLAKYGCNNSAENASRLLNEIGFAGIKYDGRQDGECYVVFNEKDAKITDRVNFFKGKDGEVLGFTTKGKVYIDPRKATAETPIHEYAHLWSEMIRRANPKAWGDIVKLMQGETALWEKVAAKYPELKGDALVEEVLAHYSGKRGAERINAEIDAIANGKGTVIDKAEAIGALARLKALLNKFWEAVSDLLHIRFTKAEDVADRVLADLLNGVNPNEVVNKAAEKKAERDSIVDRAKATGSYMKAPNGKTTKLNEKQWVEVRTKAFKGWFGDWEKASRIEKLRNSETVVITGKEIEPSDDLKQYKKNALEYGKTLRGEYINKDTGEKIFIGKNGLKEILHHDYKNAEQLQSIASIPQIIQESVFIDSEKNTDTKVDADKFDYYACGLKINGVDYTVRSVFVTLKDGTKYYDHKLTQIEKGSLIDSLFGTTPGFNQKNSLISGLKDTKLLSILQTNHSKVLDENGEPLVVYHQTESDITTFDINRKGAGAHDEVMPSGIFTKPSSSDIGLKGKKQIPLIADIKNPLTFADREDAKRYWMSNVKGYKEAIEELDELNKSYQQKYDELEESSDKEYVRLWNERKNETLTEEEYQDRLNESQDTSDKLLEEWSAKADKVSVTAKNLINDYIKISEHDGVILENDKGSFGRSTKAIILFTPNQIKSATENNGDYSKGNDDIRYSKAKDESLERINDIFNKELSTLTEENADSKILYCGVPSTGLLLSGIPNREIALYGNKLIKKAKLHGFNLLDIANLPTALKYPIAVFSGSYENGRAVLAEMIINGNNALVGIDIRKGEVQDLNIITSVFDKGSKGVINWILSGKTLWIDKEKTLKYLSSSALNADATNISEFSSATKIINEFKNPNESDVKNDDIRYSKELNEISDNEKAKKIAQLKKQKARFMIELSRESNDGNHIKRIRSSIADIEREIAMIDSGEPQMPLPEHGEKKTDPSFADKMNNWRDELLDIKSKESRKADKLAEEFIGLGYAEKVKQAKSEEEVGKQRLGEIGIDVSSDGLKQTLKEQIYERRRTIEVSNWEDAVLIHDIKKATTTEERKALPFIIEGTYEGEVSPKLQEIATKIRNWWDYEHLMLSREGILYSEQYLDNYVTHIWDYANSAPGAKERYDSYMRMSTPYSRERQLRTLAQGLSFGLKMKYDDITDIMADYGHKATEAVANNRIVNYLKCLTIDGKEALLPVDVRDYDYKVMTHDALKGYQVHKKAEKVLNVIFGRTHMSDNETLQKIGHYYDVTGSVLKKINLSASFFHHLALTEAAVAAMHPYGAMKVLLKNILWDAAVHGEVPAFNDVSATKDAVSHFVQLGATQDYLAKEVNTITGKLSNLAKESGDPIATGAFGMLDFINKGMDKVLWEYLHDGYKTYYFGKIAAEIRADAAKKNWDEKTLNKALDEAGQYVNDTFGGQHWDLLGVSPITIKFMRRALLSPDWTLSTTRHFASQFGFGQLYNDDKFWRKWFKDNDIASVRKKYGRSFWVMALFYSFFLFNGLNACSRYGDEQEDKAKAEIERKKNPLYKSPYELAYPNGMKWYDYTMAGNAEGHKTHLFVGRYDDGRESYVRWGKQFREVPELIIGRDGISFPGPFIDRITSKLNPMVNLISNVAWGQSLNGYENSYMRNKRGWEREIARVQALASAFTPYSIPTDDEKQMKMWDLFMPTSKGFSKWKAIDQFKTAVASGDMDYVGKVYDGCVMNNLNAEELLTVATKEIEAVARKEMIEGVENLNDAMIQYDTEQDPKRKLQLNKFIKKQLSAQNYTQIERAEAIELAVSALKGADINENKAYISLSKADDVRDEWRISKAKAGLKRYADKYKGLTETDYKQSVDYYNLHKREIDMYRYLSRAGTTISHLKRGLVDKNQNSNNDSIMVLIRNVRKNALER